MDVELLLLHDLGEDLLIKILSLCDVYSVLSVSAVNKYLSKVASTKQLWVVLMQNLVTNGLLVPPSKAELALYSTADIIDDIKRIVHGPQTWEPAATLPPIIHRQITFDLHLDAASLRGIQLLPGGKYAVVETSNAVKLYAIFDTRCIWEKPAPKVRSMATDMSCDGSVLRILLAPKQLSKLGDFSERAEFIIHEIDLTSGHSREVFTLPMPPENIFDMWWCIDLQENLFLIQTMTMSLTRGHMFILIDWYTSQQVILSYQEYTPGLDLSPRLAANHILAMGRARIPQFEGLNFLVTAIADLEHYWHPLNIDVRKIPFTGDDLRSFPINPPMPENRIPTTAKVWLEFEGTTLDYPYKCSPLVIHPSPLRTDKYKIRIYLSALFSIPPPRDRLLLNYTFSPTLAPAQMIEKLAAFSTVQNNPVYGISYAGYALQWHGFPTTVVADMDSGRAKGRKGGVCVMQKDERWDHTYFSPLDGALIGVVDSSVIICYYM
ncbi:hypothetical protein R3P38DRAFT_3374706 [Favolaschia claudopus]|uniref:F-box domain-containing protein n=1 Tax=Favolaschia claudopus TaxID=2862362 RepID=A0AAV9ZME9_9AGAR